MTDKAFFRIDVEAAKALVGWKALFAEEVARRARQLAGDAGQQNVGLAHYRQAAQSAIQALSAAILEGGPSRDDHQAA